ncbi:hypothetical protein MN116_007034 [Schistosoma mekongi]|uniref:Unconventional prefoldin RPB5 interactor n=1 Tax=Schistosoma mekongi TaxID=38744 RepID=A0AAE1Z911_SCHME|nr:hypothetical protein MN116_007034 [Schistosoma mekongi]
MAMNPENFGRLLTQQTSDIEVTEQEIINLEKYKSDYESVINKIEELQKSVYKDAYIPFSRKALVRGRLIHTNELLVYLGGTEDYFAELSVYETVQLLNYRIKQLQIKLDGLHKQKTLLCDRINYTRQLVSQKSISIPKNATPTFNSVSECLEDDKEIEIREEYDSDAEIEWKKKHISSRKQEHLANASKCSPVLTTRRVSFDSSEQVIGEKYSDSENISNLESDSDDGNLSTIYFQHSDIPSLVPRRNVVDISTLTIAEAVNFASEICSTHDKYNVSSKEPFNVTSGRQPDALIDAVTFASGVCNAHSKRKVLQTEPFGDICEHKSDALGKPNIPLRSTTTETKRCSRFRSSRIKDSKLS